LSYKTYINLSFVFNYKLAVFINYEVLIINHYFTSLII